MRAGSAASYLAWSWSTRRAASSARSSGAAAAIEGPVVGVRNRRGGAHLRGDRLRVVEQLDLHRLVVALLARVVRSAVVLVPVLIPRPARERRIVDERHDGPVFACQQVARRHQAGGAQQVEDFGDRRGGDALAGKVVLFLLRVHPGMHLERDPERLGCQSHYPPAGELLRQVLRVGIGDRSCSRIVAGVHGLAPQDVAPVL